MAFYGPFSLGGAPPPPDVGDRVRQAFPGVTSVRSYPGAGGGGMAALGFTHPRGDLFPGQAPSTLDQVFASAPRLVEGTAGVAPESLTAVIGNSGLPGGGGSGGASIGPGGSASVSSGTGGNFGGNSPSSPAGANPGIGASTGPAAFSGGINIGGVNIGGNLGPIASQGIGNDAVAGVVARAGGGPLAQGAAQLGVGLGLNALSPAASLAMGVVNSVTGTLANAQTASQLNALMASDLASIGSVNSDTSQGLSPAANDTGIAALGIDPGNDLSGGASGAGGGSAGGASVICTLLHDRQRTDDAMYAATSAYGRSLPKEILRGYQAWARPLVRFCRRHPLASQGLWLLLGPLVRAWMTEMAHRQGARTRGSRLGSILLALGTPLCARLGRRRQSRRLARA